MTGALRGRPGLEQPRCAKPVKPKRRVGALASGLLVLCPGLKLLRAERELAAFRDAVTLSELRASRGDIVDNAGQTNPRRSNSICFAAFRRAVALSSGSRPNSTDS